MNCFLCKQRLHFEIVLIISIKIFVSQDYFELVPSEAKRGVGVKRDIFGCGTKTVSEND